MAISVIFILTVFSFLFYFFNMKNNFQNGQSKQTISAEEILDKSEEFLSKPETALNLKASGLEIEKLKKIAADDNNSPEIRAKAVLVLYNAYTIFPHYHLYLKYLFNDEPFKGFFLESKGNVLVAFAKANEFYENLYPNPISNYQIANAYSASFLMNNFSDQEKEYYISESEKRIKKGDELFSMLNGAKKENLQKGAALRIKANAMFGLYSNANFNKEKQVNSDEIIKLFEESLQHLEISPADYYMKNYSYYSRFYFAYFLFKLDKEKHQNKIQELLAPFSNTALKDYMAFGFLVLSKNTPDSVFSNKNYMNDLASVDPNFKKVIDEL